MLQMRFDLRAPSFGAPIADIYRGALEMSEWAERQGFSMVALSEHHGSDDGYCPSPLVVAAAITARTTTLRVLVAALVLPLHDPVRLADDKHGWVPENITISTNTLNGSEVTGCDLPGVTCLNNL